MRKTNTWATHTQSNNSPDVYLALNKRSQQDEDGNTCSDNEVNEVPEGQATNLPQRHLLDLQAQPVPLVPQGALKANQHHLQSYEREARKNEKW